MGLIGFIGFIGFRVEGPCLKAQFLGFRGFLSREVRWMHVV